MLFQAENDHAESCGAPPEVRAGEHAGASYFENAYGEQWVFVYDGETKQGRLYGGDIGWENVVVFSDPEEVTRECVLNAPERLWLAACWTARNPDWRARTLPLTA